MRPTRCSRLILGALLLGWFGVGLRADDPPTDQTATATAPAQPQDPTTAPSVDKVCQARLGEKGLDQLGDTLGALENLAAAVKDKAGPPPPQPPIEDTSVVVVGGPPPAPPSPTLVQTSQKLNAITANYGVYLAQATNFQSAAAAEVQAAHDDPDPAKQAEHYKAAQSYLDQRDGITSMLAERFKEASQAAANVGVTEPTHHTIQFHSSTFDALQQLSTQVTVTNPTTGRPEPAATDKIISASMQTFDGAAKRSYDVTNEGIGSHFFTRPESVNQNKEPGGIKFSGARAEELAAQLDVTTIAFDPVRGQIVLGGPKTGQVFDLDVFADVLRLAAEEYEPFFSLDSSDSEAWDASLTRIDDALRKKYPDDRDVALRVRELSPTGIRKGDRIYYYTTVEQLDPELALSANKGRDLTVKLVFSPAWLRYSKVGTILYEADLAIKSVASGFLDHDGSIEPSFVWHLPDFNPVWLDTEGGMAGRANFELAHAILRQSSARVDLTEIHPGLYVTQRRAGTDQDLKPSDHDVAISRHFDAHWRDYVANVPEIARLEMVFRAYVAARFLIEHHPGLAARIQAMPRTIPPTQPPLRMVMPSVIRVAFQGDEPVTLAPNSRGLWGLCLGYGGGIRFGLEPSSGEAARVQVQDVPVDSNDWFQGLLAAAAYGDEGYVEHNDRAAAVIDFDATYLPWSWHLTLLGVIAAFVAVASALAIALGHFGWQRLARLAACRHCTRVHQRLGMAALPADAIAVITMLYVSLLPLVAAYDLPWSTPQIISAFGVLAGVTACLVLLGLVCRATVSSTDPAHPRSRGPITAAAIGAELVCVALAIYLFRGGFSDHAVGGAAAHLLGSAVAERVFAKLGGVAPITFAVLIGLAATLVATLLRWAGPYLFASRPLALFSPAASSHSHP